MKKFCFHVCGDRHSGTHLCMILCSKSITFWDKWVPEEPVPLRAVCLRAGSLAACKGLNYYRGQLLSPQTFIKADIFLKDRHVGLNFPLSAYLRNINIRG